MWWHWSVSCGFPKPAYCVLCYLGSCWVSPVAVGHRMYWVTSWLSQFTVSGFHFFFSSFFMISPTDQQVHCWAWLKNHLPEDSNLTIEDVTWKYTGNASLKADLMARPEVTNGVLCLLWCLWSCGWVKPMIRLFFLASCELGDIFPFLCAARRV